MTNHIGNIVGELDQLLDQEREALMAGDLQRIARLSTLKADLVDQVNALGGSTGATLARLHSKVERNQTLLISAMEGIRTVADRMARIRQVRKGLETYDQAGRRVQVTTEQESKVEKRT